MKNKKKSKFKTEASKISSTLMKDIVRIRKQAEKQTRMNISKSSDFDDYQNLAEF